MFGSITFVWLMFMVVFLVMPISYGWGYRGWGMPYPSYIQQRRAQRRRSIGSSSSFDHRAWGLGGDVMWIVVFVGLIWAFSPLHWH